MCDWKYYFRLREPGIGCQPSKGLISIHAEPVEVEGYKFWGYAVYDRMLEDEEVTRFDIYNEFDILDWKYEAKKQRIMSAIAPIQYEYTAVQIGTPEKYCIVHPCSRPEYKWQVTYLDSRGPSSHHNDNNLLGIIKDIMDCGSFDLNCVEYA